MEIQATKVFESNWEALDSKVRYIINEGGSRSSKTYSICQMLILYAFQNPNKIISVIRKAGTTVRRTIMMQDFIPMLHELGLYDRVKHNKSNASFEFPTGSVITFLGADDEQKLRGMKHSIAWINEANELQYEDAQQIIMRCEETIILDYNPSANSSWIYEIPAEKSIKIHSTYKDNPFLSKEQVETIEGYKLTDDSYYQIFALGKRCFSKENVYSKWEVVKEKPAHLDKYIYGLDFGFTHPTALVKIWYHPEFNDLFIEEIIYESGYTSSDIINEMVKRGVEKDVEILADWARPEIINDLKRSGFRVMNAIKDVKDGINNVKTFKIYVSSNSTNTIKENELYKYKKINGQVVDDIVKLNDDAMDAIRYGVFYIKKYLIKQPGTSKTTIHSFNW